MKNKRGSVEPKMSESTHEVRGTIFENCTYTSADGTSGGTVWYALQDNTSDLLGKVLTIVDATYVNKEQGEAVKSLIKDAFGNYRRPSNWTCTGSYTPSPAVTFSN